MTSLTSLIRDFIRENPSASTDVLADKICDVLTGPIREMEPEDLVKQLRPLILSHIPIERAKIRSSAETSVFTSGERFSRYKAIGDADHGAVRKQEARLATLYSTAFHVPDKGTVLWGDATPEDHEAACGYIDVKIRGFRATQRRHAKAAETIRKQGAACLREVPVAVVMEFLQD